MWKLARDLIAEPLDCARAALHTYPKFYFVPLQNEILKHTAAISSWSKRPESRSFCKGRREHLRMEIPRIVDRSWKVNSKARPTSHSKPQRNIPPCMGKDTGKALMEVIGIVPRWKRPAYIVVPLSLSFLAWGSSEMVAARESSQKNINRLAVYVPKIHTPWE